MSEKFFSSHALNIHVHRFRAIAVSLVLASAFIGAIVQFAGNGIQVTTFQSTDLDEAGQKDLLDKYNSISAGLTTLMMKPLDIFLSMVVSVAFLCLATRVSVHHETRRGYVVTAVIGVVGYLMNTGFSALNMQVAPGKIKPIITSSDLAVEDFYNTAKHFDDDEFFATLWNTSLRDDAPENSVLNTILLNLFVTTAKAPTSCNLSQEIKTPYKETIANYGFPPRSWQQRALSKALTPNASVSVAMNTAVADPTPDENFPMSVSIASNLAVYAMVTSNSFLGWWGDDDEAWGPHAKCRSQVSPGDTYAPIDMAECLNLTTRSSPNATFMSDAHKVIVDYFDKAENASTMDELANIEFSHFDMFSTVVFDALTIDIPTKMLGKQNDNSSSSDPFFFDLIIGFCNAGACLATGVEEYNADGEKTTVYPRVQALAICLNEAGGEELVVNSNYSFTNEFLQFCKQTSNTSMIIVSVGKRVEGDSFQNHPMDMGDYVQIVNARVVYSLTVGRLSWTVENLAEVYNATCESYDGCGGIRFPLERAHNSSDDFLLVSNFSIPMNLLSPINMNVDHFPVGSSQWKILASTLEETRGGDLASSSAADPIVLPRNFKKMNATLAANVENSQRCDLMVEKYLSNIEVNHLYIESTLQPAYTAGLYFIFQNAVVLEQLPSNATGFPTKPSLAFSGNIQDMSIQASIPAASMRLAIIGCTMMVLGGITITVFGKRGQRALFEHGTAVTTAEAIANSDKFPPFMLRLQLRDVATGKLVDVSLDSLRVENVVLVDADENHHFVVGGNQLSRLGFQTNAISRRSFEAV